jgi:hypothetical protein
LPLYRLLIKGSEIETVDRLLAFTQFKSSLAKKWTGKKMKTSKTTIFLPPHLFAPLQTTAQGFGNRNSRSIACIHSIQVILGKKMARQKDEDIQNYHLFASSSFCHPIFLPKLAGAPLNSEKSSNNWAIQERPPIKRKKPPRPNLSGEIY